MALNLASQEIEEKERVEYTKKIESLMTYGKKVEREKREMEGQQSQVKKCRTGMLHFNITLILISV